MFADEGVKGGLKGHARLRLFLEELEEFLHGHAFFRLQIGILVERSCGVISGLLASS